MDHLPFLELFECTKNMCKHYQTLASEVHTFVNEEYNNVFLTYKCEAMSTGFKTLWLLIANLEEMVKTETTKS